MERTIEEEMVDSGLIEDPAVGSLDQDPTDQNQDQEVKVGMGDFFTKIFNLFTVKTGEGSISDYADHPLNFDGSDGVGQMIRGATGMLGSLDRAIIDLAIGYFKFKKSKKVI